MPENIDYENLKSRGFLKQKQEGFFVFRTRMTKGVYGNSQLEKVNEIAKKFGRSFVHVTVRQGLEIPFIKYEDISKVEDELKHAGVDNGTSGARLRATTVCPGNNWCKQGLIDTFYLSDKLEEMGIKCGLMLPHKFKIAISGCPNTCTRPQQSEVGIHGIAGGFALYIGGSGGKIPHLGFKIEKIFKEEDLLNTVKKIVDLFGAKAKPRQRLFSLIEEMGRENFLKEVL